MAIVVVQVGIQAENVADTTIEKSMIQLDHVLDTRLASRYKSIQETAENLARDGRLLPLIYDEEAASLQDQCDEFGQSLDFDILMFINAEGVILARSDDPDGVGVSVIGSELFRQALSGKSAMGIMKRQSDLLQLIAVPVFDNAAPDIVRGAVALGYKLSRTLANEIRNLTGSEIAFYCYQLDRQRTLTGPPLEICNTFADNNTILQDYFDNSPDIYQQLFTKGSVLEEDIKLDTEIFHMLLRPLMTSDREPIGFVAALRSRTELLKPFVIIKNRVLIIGLVGLLVTSVISYGIARQISKPIIGLVSVTRSIQDGDYPDPVPVKRTDEVGLLYRAIYQMGQELKEKAELENYLATLTEDVDDIEIAPADLQTDITSSVSENDATMLENNFGTDAKDELRPGTIIGDRYRVEKTIGAGAMGIVYLANDTELNELVALKMVINPNLTGDILEQFKQEIKLARQITQKNVLRTHDFGTFKGFHYISMEYVQGKDLSQLIKKKGYMDIKMGIMLARQMCSAIAEAHSQGIVHRDLKPQNMMINKRGILKIMDFGIAINIQQPVATDGSQPGTFEKNAMVGTPNFMSPEQFSGVDVDLRSDIYSLGVILYYMFSGELPFTDSSLWNLAQKHINEAPPKMLQKRENIPSELEALIMKALAKNREDRFSTAGELGIALAEIKI